MRGKRNWSLAVVILIAAMLAPLVGENLVAQSKNSRNNVPPREAFLSGSERSVPVLNEILATLKQMDARLARIEAAAIERAERL